MSVSRPKLVLVLLTAIAVVLGLASIAQAAPVARPHAKPAAKAPASAPAPTGPRTPARPADTAAAKARARSLAPKRPKLAVKKGARDAASAKKIIAATPTQRVEPAAAAIVSNSTDSTLSGLTVAGAGMQGLAPAFAPATRDYEVVLWDTSTVSISPITADANAAAVVSAGGTSYPQADGTASVPVVRGGNDVKVLVTSADHSTTTTYTVHVWVLVATGTKIVSVKNNVTSKFGGIQASVVVSDGALPRNCGRNYYVGGYGASLYATTYDATTNLATDEVMLYELPNRATGTFDLTVQTSCWAGGGWVWSTATRAGAITYVDSFTVDRVDVPSTVSAGAQFMAYGKYFSAQSDIRYWLSDAQGNVETDIWTWGWAGNGASDFTLDYPWGEQFFKGAAGPRTLHLGYCPPERWEIDDSCTSVWSGTVNWKPPVPQNISFSPSSGPVSGGTLVKLKGRYASYGSEDVHVYIGGHEVDGLETYGHDSDTYDEWANGLDKLEFNVPAGMAPGTYPVTVTTDIGTGTARGSFTVSAKPLIDAVAPATVANVGGSVLTITGSNFGTAGQPTVIVNGTKSPFVKRVSAGKVLAVVPDQTGITGAVNVSVGSPQGGGVSDAVSLTLAAPSAAPTVTAVAPASAQADDTVTLTGTGFATTGTAVSVDGNWTLPTAVSATSLTFDLPGTDTTGPKDVVVATPTGAVTKAHYLTVLPEDGIASVSPTTVVSYATGNAAKISIDGAGFGATGTVKVGGAAAVSYTATAGGTHIAGVVVPTAAAGLLPVVVTPKGSTTSFRGSVTVTAPTFSYVGSDPYSARYAPVNVDVWPYTGGYVLAAPTTGGVPVLLKGTGFGPAGQLKVDGAVVTPKTWTDTEITFDAPAHAKGVVAVSVKPTGSSLLATRDSGIEYTVPPASAPTLAKVFTVTDYDRPRNQFDPVNDLDNRVTVTGNYLTGSASSKTRVVLTQGNEVTTLVPTAVTATSLTFLAPRNLVQGWKNLSVSSDIGSSQFGYGFFYMSAGVTITASPWSGLCKKQPLSATGGVTYTPATTTISASAPNVFGSSGTVTIDGVTITPTSYGDQEIVLPMTGLASELTNPWGGKGIVVTPTDTSLPAQTIGFTCAETPSVTTTVNGGTDAVTVAAGTAYTLGYTTTGFVGNNPFSATAPDGYEYVTDGDYQSTGFNANVRAGAPTAAGDYWVRVSLGRATYDRAPYFGFWPSVVHVTITGLPLSVTPVSKNGSSFTYKGQLGDGTNSTALDVDYTASPSPTGINAITKVAYQYRDSQCENAGVNQYWSDGLPKNVAHSATYCGGDGTTPTSWDVRVKSVTMDSSGTDRSIYYATTFPTVRITINPRNVSVAAVRADKVYDGTNVAPLGDLSFTNAIEGDDLGLNNASTGGTFADATPGANKPVTLGAALSLAGGDRGNYVLTNPNPTIVGTISKAPAVLSLDSSSASILLSQTPTVTITATSTNPLTGQPVDNTAAAIALSSKTTRVCTISGTTVTGLAAGTCTIAGSQPASADYLAAKAASDETSTVETIDIQVFAAPRTITVVADDLTVGVGDDISPTYQVSGLFDGDSVDGVDFAYYSGTTLLNATPTTAGTYRIVPTGGTLTAASDQAYTNPSAFGYVAGKLVITPPPPTIDSIAPLTGSVAGGTKITITGTRLDTVKAVHIGSVTLKRGDFTVNADGTVLTFVSPKVAQPGGVSLELAAGAATAQDVFTYVAPTHPKPPAKKVPSAPRAASVSAGNHVVVVTFTVPKTAGSAKISSYEVSTDGGRTWHTASVTVRGGKVIATLSHVVNGVRCTVLVRARNAVGAGPSDTAGSVLVDAPWKHRLPSKSLLPVPADPKHYHGKVRETDAAYATGTGDPAHPIADLGDRQLVKGDAITTLDDSVFAFDSAKITAHGWKVLRLLAKHLKHAHALRIEGYTDYAGDAHHELKLSQQRAAATARALAKLGVHVTFSTKGYGGTRPAVVGGSAQSRAANRRVVVQVVR